MRKLPFKQYFADERPAVRKAAISLAAAVGTKDHLIMLVEYFTTADFDEQSQIVESIATMPIEEAEEILEILSKDGNPAVAVRALEHLRKGHA
jgi:HEAT repeat protein